MAVSSLFLVFSIVATLAAAAPPPPPDVPLDCALRQLLVNTSAARLPWLPAAASRVADALQLGACPGAAVPTPASLQLPLVTPQDEAEIRVFVSASAGDDAADGLSAASAVRSLHAAQRCARRLRGAHALTQRIIVEISGTHYLRAPLLLEGVLDAQTTWRASSSDGAAPAVISGGIPLAGLNWQPSTIYPAPVLEAALPADVPLELYSLFDGISQRRLPLAREPNGDAETMMQPTGWALVRGNVNGTLAPPSDAPPVHFEVDAPTRNNTVFPLWGRDFDPRNPPAGYVWFAEGGGTPSFYANNRSFWANHSIDAGLRWNATGGIDPHSGVRASPFNASTWAPIQEGRRAHVFHNGLWGSWVFDVAAIDAYSETMTFSKGGFQEGRGGGMSTQPFFVEGAKEALDSPAEWFVERARGVLHLWPNDTAAGPPALLVVPATEMLVTITADSVRFEGLTFAHTTDGLMEPYTSTSAGDWSIRLAAAVTVYGAADASFFNCLFRRVGSNALLITGAATSTTVDSCDFYLPGGSGIAVVGYLPRASAADEGAAYPIGVTIRTSIFEGIGVLGKQTSALYVSLACNVTMSESVLFSGPRSGININDGFCGSHVFERNILFDWVRETQDHGPINTWSRARYDAGDGTEMAAWSRIVGNAIYNGPSDDRDLGNLYPAVDNDDGSALYWVADNLAVYGAFKNYLGSNKKWLHNLIVHPQRWSGDACLTAWGGLDHLYAYNTCLTQNGFPQAFDSSLGGDTCVMNYTDPITAPYLPQTHDNIYSTPDGSFATGCDTMYNLAQLQAVGAELGSKVVKGYAVADIMAQAAALLA